MKGLFHEPDGHVTARRLQVIIWVLLFVASVATIFLFLFYRPLVFLAAVPIPILIFVWAIVGELERRSKRSVLRSSGQTHISNDEVEANVAAAGIATAVKIGVALVLGTFIMAAALFDLASIGIGAAALLMLVILFQFPFLGLLVNQARRDERERMQPQTDPATPKVDVGKTSRP